MKKIIAMVLSLIAVLSFVACDKNNSLNNSASNESSFNSSDNYNSESSENSSNADSSLPNEDPPVVITPPEDENPYPNSVVPVEGVNRYEHLKREAPAKTVSVVEYQNYGIEQIDVYLNAIAQDESITYDTTYLCMELTKRKYAIYTQEDFDKIDLILIDAENLLKKLILEDEILQEFKNTFYKTFEITHYYGEYNGYYFMVLRYSPFAAETPKYETDNCFFLCSGERVNNDVYYSYAFYLKRGDSYPKRINDAHMGGIISDEQLAELFQHELVKLAGSSYDYYTWIEGSYVTASNFYTFKAENSLFLINTFTQETVKCAVEKVEDITFLVNLSYLDLFKSLPYGVKTVEFGIVNHQGEILFNNTFKAHNPTEIHGVFVSPSVIDYYRDGSIKSAEYFHAWKFKVKEYMLSEYDSGWVRFYINLEYENGYKETHYGEKLYYTVNKNQYDAETEKYYNVYTFSEKFTPQEKQ